MARIRSIKPEFWQDEKLARVSRDSRLTFVGLLNCSDDYGVVRGHSLWLKNQIFPYDDLLIETFEVWLNELETIETIVPFLYHGEKYYFIKNFQKHQKVDHPSKQRNPKPPSELFNDDSRDNREDSRKSLAGKEGKGDGKEGSRKGDGGETVASHKVPRTDPASLSSYEKDCCEVLLNIKDYPFDLDTDIVLLREKITDYPDIDTLSLLKDWKIYILDKPFDKKSRPRSQLANQYPLARKYKKHLKESKPVMRDASGRVLEVVG